LNQFKDPKVLPCLHTYCKNCLEQLLVAATLPPPKRQLTCPQCKEIHQVPPEGIDSFKTYFTINNLLELLQIHKSSGEGLSSGMTLCESGLDKNPALGRCLTCSEYLCKDCFAIHQQLKITKDHSLITLEKIRLSDGSLDVKNIIQRKQYCEEHHSEELKLFCKTCERVICRDCALVKHREHNYSFVSEACCDVQKTLKGLLKAVKQKEREFRVNKKHIEETRAANGCALGSCLKQVNTACDQLIESVEARRAFLVAQLHSAHEGVQAELKQKSTDVEHSLSRLSNGIHFTEKLLSSSDEVEMMTIGIQARDTLSALKAMSWDKESVKPMLTRVKFAPPKLNNFGKILDGVQSNELAQKSQQVSATKETVPSRSAPTYSALLKEHHRPPGASSYHQPSTVNSTRSSPGAGNICTLPTPCPSKLKDHKSRLECSIRSASRHTTSIGSGSAYYYSPKSSTSPLSTMTTFEEQRRRSQTIYPNINSSQTDIDDDMDL
jgi:hypothetical protein